MAEKLSFLIGSIILVLLIVFWPIYFFIFSMFSIIPLGPDELLFFAIVVVLWEFYKRHYKK